MIEMWNRPFWTEAGAKALVVEADAFKETDVIYRAISSMGHHNDMLQTAELVRILYLTHFIKAAFFSASKTGFF